MLYLGELIKYTFITDGLQMLLLYPPFPSPMATSKWTAATKTGRMTGTLCLYSEKYAPLPLPQPCVLNPPNPPLCSPGLVEEGLQEGNSPTLRKAAQW